MKKIATTTIKLAAAAALVSSLAACSRCRASRRTLASALLPAARSAIS